MKTIKIFLFLFLPFFINAQIFRGNITFSKKQKESFIENYSNPQYSPPLIIEGYSNEVGAIKLGATEFFRDISTGGVGTDRGGWYPVADMVVNGSGSNPMQPFGNNYGLPRRLYNIHFAALDAFANNNKRKAAMVIDELINQSQNQYLDFSNETVFDRTKRSYVNPVFMMAAKMNQYRISYGLVHDLVKGYKNYEDNKAVLNDWLKEAADYFKAIVDNNITYWVLSGDFQSESPMGIRSSPLDNFYTHWNSAGTVGFNEVSDFQFNVFNNRIARLVEYVGGYGMAFGEEIYSDWYYNYFKKNLQLGVFPDNTISEQARGGSTYNGGNQPSVIEGITYSWENIYAYIRPALDHSILVEKGFETNYGKYFNYTTSIGTNELISSDYSNYSSTSGGEKNLESLLINLSKYYTGEFQRYNNLGTLIYPEEETYSVTTAMANTYYGNKELEYFYKFDIEQGYPPADKNDVAFAVKPSNFGIAIGNGSAHGGIVGYYEQDGEMVAKKAPYTIMTEAAYNALTQLEKDVSGLVITIP